MVFLNKKIDRVINEIQISNSEIPEIHNLMYLSYSKTSTIFMYGVTPAREHYYYNI